MRSAAHNASSCGKLDPAVGAAVVKGVAAAAPQVIDDKWRAISGLGEQAVAAEYLPQAPEQLHPGRPRQ